MKEPNPFEDLEIADQWIQAIEGSHSRSREKELYPLLFNWTQSHTPKVILDLGCGQGVCSSKVALYQDDKYIGIEPSIPLLNRAKEIYKEKNKIFLIGDSYSMPLESESVDQLFSVGVLFHILDLNRAHREIARVLRSGGEILFLTANPSERSLWESWFENPKINGKIIEGKVRIPGGVLENNLFYIHSKEEIQNSLLETGFEHVSFQELGFGGGERKQAAWIAVKATKI